MAAHKHPRILGYRKNGAPIWSIAGASPDDPSNEDQGGPTLTHSQSVNRIREITTRLEELGERSDDDITAEEEDEFRQLTDEFSTLDKHRKRLERKSELARVKSAADGIGRRDNGGLRTERANGNGYDRDPILEPDSVEDHRFRNPWDLSEVRTFGRSPEEVGEELHARALSAIEQMQAADDKVREAGTNILEQFEDKDHTIARFVLLTSSPAYVRAWSKLARNAQSMLSDDERRAVDEVRRLSLTDTEGGYLVPFQLDPTVIVTADGSRNDIRNAATQVVATGDKWHGVSAGSVQWRWAAEGSEAAADQEPTFGQPTVDVHKADGFVPITLEALQDAQNITATVAQLFAEGREELEAPAFINGTGTGQPFGLITSLVAAGGSVIVAPTTAETFDLADVYKLQGALPSRHRAMASWLANNLIYNLIRQFDTAGGAGLWARLGEGRPEGLLSRPVLEAEDMDGVINPAVTESNPILAFGNFRRYVIADRIGMTVEFIPHLFGTNRRPTGERGWYAYYRTGADVVHPGAFRLLDVATVTP